MNNKIILILLHTSILVKTKTQGGKQQRRNILTNQKIPQYKQSTKLAGMLGIH